MRKTPNTKTQTLLAVRRKDMYAILKVLVRKLILKHYTGTLKSQGQKSAPCTPANLTEMSMVPPQCSEKEDAKKIEPAFWLLLMALL